MGQVSDARLERRFEAAVIDWDDTVGPNREAPAGEVRRVLEQLCERGFDTGVVSRTHVDEVDGRLAARPSGPGRLYLCVNRGSEAFTVGPEGPRLVNGRIASPEEEAALTAAAELTVERLATNGLRAAIVADRLDRMKIDLMCGSAAIAEAVEVARTTAQEAGLAGAPEAGRERTVLLVDLGFLLHQREHRRDEEAETAVREAAAAAEELGDPDLLSTALDLLQSWETDRGRYGEGYRTNARRIELIPRMTDVKEIGDTYAVAAWAAAHLGRYREADEHATACIERSRGVCSRSSKAGPYTP